ncbi:MAG: alginate export family protein, partial [Tepidisphaeraceae bacterium]
MPVSEQPRPEQPRPAATTQPAYTPVRWNEDYGYLKDPAKRTDPFDPIKYIPLNEQGDWYLSLGGQARSRYELFDNFNFGAGPQDGNGFHLLRLLGHADAHFGPNLRTFMQVKSAFADGRDLDPRPIIDEDDFDIEQAFADVKIPFDGGGSVTLRGGRQNLLYGAQRLISPLDWTNTRRTFDGGKASIAFPKNNTLDLFYVHPVLVDEKELNSFNDNVAFAGAYDVLLLPDLIQDARSKLELYALYLDNRAALFAQGMGQEERYTLGARFWTNPNSWDLDLEAAYQFGEFGDGGDISAWMVAFEAGYTFADATFSPRLYLGFDVASGDDDPGDEDLGTFNQLFPLGHAYFGYIDVVGRQNIVDLHPGLELTLLQNRNKVKKLALRADYHLFWRYSDDDALYNAAGTVLRPAGGSDEHFVGSEIDLLLNWQIDRHLAAYIGYSHLFAGDFIDETGAATGFDEDIDFFYVA